MRTPYHRREEDHQSNCRSNHQYSVGTQTAEVLINGLSPDQSGGNPTWARCCRVVTVPIMFFIMHIIGKEAYVIAVNVLSAKERGGEGEDCCECSVLANRAR
ncbi:hypothetical protein NC653_021602 [Populus alba x Populus x berolinensis]|uniref:Uncharacterized protein n=1 Tax=Populus alba x Populus x berolinensis TaxID=444605 RepID=A0AAD6MPZ3_9ROSI|nr:hypothetical protein NC653_021602 [Populus alba x Populus x berolinensis]